MKRFSLFLFATAAAIALTCGAAGANTVHPAGVTVTCTSVGFSWTHFPEKPIALHIQVTQGEDQTNASVNTKSEPEGSGSVPLTLTGTGPVTAKFSWALGYLPHRVSVTRTLDCVPEKTTPPTTSAPKPPAKPPAPPTTVVQSEGFAPPVSITPAVAAPELPMTGASHAWLLALLGWLILGTGAALIFGARMRRDEQ